MPSPTYQWTKALLAYMRSNLWSILESMKWIRGYGTRLVWNSVMSTLRAPSNLREAVREEITCETRRFKLVYVGRSMSRQRRQMSLIASSVCSRSEWVASTALYGSTTAVDTCGDG